MASLHGNGATVVFCRSQIDEDGEEGNKLWKSDLYVLINQIHSDLVGKRV